MLQRSQAGIAAINAGYWAGVNTKKKGTKTMGTNQTPLRDVVEFPPNTPLTVAIKYAQPKLIQGRGGEDRAMYSLTDGRVMFLDADLVHEISGLGVRPGEPFQIEMKWTGKKGDPKIYHVWKGDQNSQPPAPSPQPPSYGPQRDGTYAVPASPEPESKLMRDMRESIMVINARKNGGGANGDQTTAPQDTNTPQSTTRLRTKLEWALITAVQACYGAEQHAQQIGYTAMPRFTSEDIRTMANTLIIDSQRQAGGAR